MIYPRTRNVLKFYEWFLLLFLIVSGLFTIVWLRSAITALEYNIARLEEEKKEIIRERKELLAQKVELSSLHRIHEVAFKRKGLTFPDRRKVNLVKRNEVPEVLSVKGTIKLDRLFFNEDTRDNDIIFR